MRHRAPIVLISLIAGLVLTAYNCDENPHPNIVVTCQLDDQEPVVCDPPFTHYENLPVGHHKVTVRAYKVYKDANGDLRFTEPGEDSWEWDVTG